jgi:hypothetical protein
MPDQNLGWLKEVGGVLKFGSGALGKSAVCLVVLLVAVIVAAMRLHSDAYILGAIGIGTLIFFGWLFPVLRFAHKHPDAALLEGAEWSAFQRFQAQAKGYIPLAGEQQPTIAPGAQIDLPQPPEPPDAET